MKGEDDMYCKKCGKMIEENAQFCDSCGSPIVEQTDDLDATKQETTPVNEYVQPATQDESPFYTVPEETSIPTPTENTPESKTILQKVFAGFRNVIHGYTHFKSLSKGKKVAYIVVPIIVFALICVSFSGGSDSSDGVVKTGRDDYFGGVSFRLTLDQMIEQYNHLQNNRALADYEDRGQEFINSYVKLQSIQKSQFSATTSEVPGYTNYVYEYAIAPNLFSGSNTPQKESLAFLFILVDDETGNIQRITYASRESYRTEQSEKYYQTDLPIIVFGSLLDGTDWIDKLYGDQLTDGAIAWDDGILFTRDSIEIAGTRYERHSISACTKNSDYSKLAEQTFAGLDK